MRGEPIRQECAPGLHFNPLNQQCDLPENTDCAPGEDPGNPGPDPNPNPTPTPPPEGTDPEAFNCLQPGGPFFPHPTDCRRYVICFNSIPHHQRCANGLLYDHTNLLCDIPGRATCVPGSA